MYRMRSFRALRARTAAKLRWEATAVRARREALGRRSTRGERDAGARVPSKLGDGSSGLVSLKKQRESILITREQSDRRRALKMRLVVLGAATGIESALQADGYCYRVGFVTVTYAKDDDWHPGDIKELIRHYRLWAKRRGEPFISSLPNQKVRL